MARRLSSGHQNKTYSRPLSPKVWPNYCLLTLCPAASEAGLESRERLFDLAGVAGVEDTGVEERRKCILRQKISVLTATII